MDRVFIIAEAGVNHNGDVEIAKKMIKAAAHAGADAIKFQTFKAENLVTKTANKSDYQKSTTYSTDDTLLKFKRNFSIKTNNFYIGKRVINRKIYDEIVFQWQLKTKKKLFDLKLLKYRYFS